VIRFMGYLLDMRIQSQRPVHNNNGKNNNNNNNNDNNNNNTVIIYHYITISLIKRPYFRYLKDELRHLSFIICTLIHTNTLTH
jgi:hypothetical protein